MSSSKDAMMKAYHDLMIDDVAHELSQQTIDALLATGALLDKGVVDTENQNDPDYGGPRTEYVLNPEHALTYAEVVMLMSEQ